MAPHILSNLILPTSWSVYVYFLPVAKTILAYPLISSDFLRTIFCDTK